MEKRTVLTDCGKSVLLCKIYQSIKSYAFMHRSIKCFYKALRGSLLEPSKVSFPVRGLKLKL